MANNSVDGNRSAADASKGVEAVDRALQILRVFGPSDDGLSLAELARRTGFYKSTILRLLASLVQNGMMERGADGTYRLGAELWRLGGLYRRAVNFEELIRQALAAVVQATNETASFYIRDGSERVCAFRQNSPQAVRHHLEEGARLALDQGASGHVLLAFDGAPGELYDRIRERRFHTTLGERSSEIGSVAVPVMDSSGLLRGVLAVSALLTRFDETAQLRALECLRDQAANLHRALPPALD